MATKKEKSKPEKVEIEKTETYLKYHFSQDELVKIGEEVADIARNLSTVEAEAKSISKQYKADIERLELESSRQIQLIRDKSEMRKMEVFKIIDPLARRVYFFRCDQIEAGFLLRHDIDELRELIDSGEFLPEVAKVRDARPSELQRELPGLSVKSDETIKSDEAAAAS